MPPVSFFVCSHVCRFVVCALRHAYPLTAGSCMSSGTCVLCGCGICGWCRDAVRVVGPVVCPVCRVHLPTCASRVSYIHMCPMNYHCCYDYYCYCCCCCCCCCVHCASCVCHVPCPAVLCVVRHVCVSRVPSDVCVPMLCVLHRVYHHVAGVRRMSCVV